eukprot:SAG11_NODE_2243_length_3641_cov_2.533597_3_plen_72_part_00
MPVDCGYAFFRALRTRGVPTELAVYPREPHGVTERAHLIDMSAKTLDWLRKYLPAVAAAGDGRRNCGSAKL